MAKIMIVDDEPDVRNMLESVLRSEGHQVLPVGDGLEALKILRGLEEVDIMVTDLHMVPVDGLEIIETGHAERPDMDIIVLSAFINDDTFQRLVNLGVSGFVDKPFTLEDLFVPIREILIKRSSKH
ncbi:MAG TPA: response regulator [Kiritimatiellia bacterium]|nr:response regulator [Kiritimatiellia bacterium]HNR94216.1 response regulator [Kiritimatiellia bacterium]HNS81887.1 response regulator [Kiritimatiellia bacterium]HPA78195.1 response regulator [Kiritimatiellia bacterium]HQQ04461.1 response regulator [Kiritimatiellia bacterium]